MIDQATNELRKRLLDYVEDVLIPAEPELDASGDFNSHKLNALRDEAKARGLWALGHSRAVGGGGVPFLPFVDLNEVIGRSEWGMYALGTASMHDCMMLAEHGTDAQRERYLGDLVSGATMPSTALTEPDVAGSDPTLMTTTAVSDGGDWIINGHKWFVSCANISRVVFCRTESDQESTHGAFTSILVPTDSRGYRITRVIPTIGTIAPHCEVTLDNVRVPKGATLGRRGEGFVIAQRRLAAGRILHCMRWLGQAQRAFDMMCDRASQRYSHGGLLADKGEIRRFIADSAVEMHASRLMTLDAARLIDGGAPARTEISMIKVFGAQMLHNVIDRAIQVHGALGVFADLPLERMYRNARYARIYDGPDEVHRMVVARRMLRKNSTRAYVPGGDSSPGYCAL